MKLLRLLGLIVLAIGALVALTFAQSTTITLRTPTINASVTPGSGTGITNCEDLGGQIRCTIGRTAFIDSSTISPVTVGTVPGQTRIRSVDAHIDTPFVCGSVCTTLSLTFVVGIGTNQNEFLACAPGGCDADAGVAWFGDASGEIGSFMDSLGAVQGGKFFTSGQGIFLTLISGTGDIGTGAATNLSAGVVTVYIKYDILQ